ncbi:anthrone oxygenase family protein [Streptomyces sp. NPDC050738]|uniref:anthrone oxygenase family protein n=1 Tax=Streptomyces sp. NPDC050738 TaxID=3154744 RepID=UPI00342D8F49
MATTLLVLAVIATGLYAGFMFAFASGVMPGLKLLDDEQFVAAMRRINDKVPGPVFLLVFLGFVALPAAALAVPVDGRTDDARLLLVAGLVCAAVSHLVTIAGNIPLNVALEKSTASASETRAAFEARWNRLHLARTAVTTASFALTAGSSLA